jgi:hypothetical protein
LQEKLLVVWDLMTGKRDRVLSGTAADALMQQFERTLATDAPPPASASTSGPIDGGAALSAATGISLLRIDTAQLLRDGSAVELPQVSCLRRVADNRRMSIVCRLSRRLSLPRLPSSSSSSPSFSLSAFQLIMYFDRWSLFCMNLFINKYTASHQCSCVPPILAMRST